MLGPTIAPTCQVLSNSHYIWQGVLFFSNVSTSVSPEETLGIEGNFPCWKEDVKEKKPLSLFFLES